MFYLLTVADKHKNHKQIWGNITEINIYKKQILQEAGSIQYNVCIQYGSGGLLLLLTKIFLKKIVQRNRLQPLITLFFQYMASRAHIF